MSRFEMKPRRIMVQDRDDMMWSAVNASAGETFECTDLAKLLRYIAADPEAGWTLTGTPVDEQDDNPPSDLREFKVVLNRNVPYGATNGIAFGFAAAEELARNYWAKAEPGHKVEIYYPPDSRDSADWRWVKGKDAGP